MSDEERYPTIGSNPDRFLASGRATRGAEGQSILYRNRFDVTGKPGSVDRFAWPIDALLPYCVLDYADEDCPSPIGAGPIHPAVGPDLAITGAVASRGYSPWRTLGRVRRTATCFPTGTRLQGTLPAALPDGWDVVALCLFSGRQLSAGGNISLSTLTGGAGTYNGVEIITVGTGAVYLRFASAGVINQAIVAAQCDGWGLAWLFVDRSDAASGVNGWYNGITGAVAAVPPGAVPSTALGIGARSGGAAALVGAVSRALLFHLPPDTITLAAFNALRQEADEAIMGIRPEKGAELGRTTVSRASPACHYPEGVAGPVVIMAQNMAQGGQVEGLGAGEGITSVAYKNHAYIAGDGTALAGVDVDAGLVVTVDPVADSSFDALAPGLGGQVIEVRNPTAGPLRVRLTNVLGSALACWASIRIHETVAGATAPRLGFHKAGGAFVQVAICDVATPAIRNYGAAVCGDAANKVALELGAGSTVRIALPCGGVGGRVPDEVPSVTAVGVSGVVAQDVVVTPDTPADNVSDIRLGLVPRFWGGAAPTAAETLVSRSGGLTNVLALTGAGAVQSTDGVNTASAAVVEADGVAEELRHSHGSRGLVVSQASGAEDVDPYKGSLGAAGTLTYRASCRACTLLEVRRNQGASR